ncbi:MAG: vWA domain-containing protein, partial [Eubacteriales bacterium]|nr:vWA domain-containing protein [Eubacteriales bacterium]
ESEQEESAESPDDFSEEEEPSQAYPASGEENFIPEESTEEPHEEESVSGEEEDTGEGIQEEEENDAGAGEDSVNEEDSAADDESAAEGASRKTFFTTEDEDAEHETGQESAQSEGEDGTSADADGQKKTFITLEEETEEEASAGRTGAAAEAGDQASTGQTGAAAEAGEEAVRPRGVADTLVFQGPDYKVTASYGEDAGIPAGASLVVFEIKEEAREYQAYCDQAQAAVAESLAGESTENSGGAGAGSTGTAAADTNVTVSWVRLFDITIEVDGVAVEPQGPVAVQIDYGQAIEQAVNEEVNTVHFEGQEEVPVVLETQTEGSGETLEQVTFETPGFSVFAVMGATITKRILASDGVGYLITLTCGPEAAVPADAELEVREIDSASGEYEDYLAKAMDALREENPAPGKETGAETDAAIDPGTGSETGEAGPEDAFAISFARFFDVRIAAGGKTIEPAAPVQVTVTYADALDMNEEDTLCAVHFAKSGTQVIQASPDEAQKAVTFMQDSFSVTGTVVTSGGGWPASGASSVMYVKSGNSYYAVAHGGGLHQVLLSGSTLIFPDDAEGFDISLYEWTHEQQSSYGRTYHYLYYTDSRGVRQYLDPSASGGISSSAVSLSRDSSGRISYRPSYTTYYIGTGSGSLVGSQTSSSKGAAIQFASDFALPRKVTIHFVDRDGNALSGVSYDGPENYPVIPNEDGTFTLPYEWDLGNAALTLHLDTDFSKDGYTYASTHLAGTREGTSLTYEGLTMDAALTERSNTLYYYADAGQSLAYGSLTERKLNDALQVPNAAGTGMTDYSGAKVDKDIYVILDPVPTYTPIQSAEGLDIEDPEFSKTLTDNEDGTYTLSLNVTGRGINASTNPKANVIFVVDTSSSMDKTEGTGTGYSRLHDTKPALKTLAQDLLLSNSMEGKDPDTVELSMISFDGGVVDEIGWTTDYNAFKNRVDNGLVLHRGTDWEDALKRAYALGLAKQAEEPDQKVFVVFFTDGEGSQYTSFHGQGTYNNTVVNPNYGKWYSYFLCRESAKDEARAIVNAGMQFYAIYAFNKDGDKYKGEAGSDLLRNLVRHAYNSEELGNRNFFARASNTAELEAAFNSILLSVREFLGVSDVVLNDDITSLTSTGINLVSSAVGGFSYSRSGGRYGSGTVWEDAPEAAHTDREDGDAGSVMWDLGSMVLEEGVTYTVSFKVWPSQEAYD